ncbi:MAG: 1-acyl-sn-glycerol-3-phosphate acyltransferase [bacterium]|nr:1-acyl-sn-glycerol-3-phosphate acyltransferase [bacterium]
MLYYLLRLLFRVANRFYFRTFQVKGVENIPEKGPVFFVANHPSAFMDPIVIATITNRRLFFLAKGALFEGRFAQWILPKFNMIPIFRSSETPGQGKKNKEIFSICYKHLAKGGAILAFPEGISVTERKLKKIQSGTARICLGAEAENNFALDLKIITVGLNFSDPHTFYSDAFINVDQAIHVSDFYEAYKQDPFKGAHALTDEIRRHLETQVVAIEDAEEDKLVARIEAIYKSQLLLELGQSPKEMADDFNTTKRIRDSVRHFKATEPKRVQEFKKEIETYLHQIERLKLNDKHIKGVGSASPALDAIKSAFYLLLGLPFFFFGFLNNYLPFRLPFWAATLITRRPDFFGSIALTMGTFAFLLFYALQIWLVNMYFSDWRITLGYAITLPISGLFAFFYYRRFKDLRGKWRIFSLFYRKTQYVAALISKRQHIVDELTRGKDDFIKHNNPIT